MNKNILKIFYILACVLIMVNLFFTIWDTFAFDLSDLPTGSKVSTTSSPNGDKLVTVYLVENNAGCGIRVQVKKNKKVENIYWQTGIDYASVKWVSNSVININDVSINIDKGGSYDCRKGYSIFNPGSIEGVMAGTQ